jgi:hypothetical protein
MSRSREKLISNLVGDLRPVHRAGHIEHWLVAWLAVAALFSITAIAATEPYRDGWLSSLLHLPGFAAESLVAVAAVTLWVRATLKSSMPSPESPLRPLLWPAAFLGAWLGIIAAGFWFPVHPVSELGHREHCLMQGQLIALVNLVALLWMARRLAPLRPRLTGALAGVAAAAVPAAIMQFACMYEPGHILTFHFAPVAVTASIGALLAPAILKRRPTSKSVTRI